MKTCPITGVKISKTVRWNSSLGRKLKHAKADASNEYYKRVGNVLIVRPPRNFDKVLAEAERIQPVSRPGIKIEECAKSVFGTIK